MKLLLSAGAALAFLLGLCAAGSPPAQLRVHTVSWNSGHVPAPTNLEEFLGLNSGENPDVIAVAVQGYGFESDKPAQGPDCVKNFQSLLTSKGYVKLKSTVTETMGLIVYCLDKHRDESTLKHQTVVGTMNHQKKSGGIVTSFTIYNKRFSFATSRMSDDDVTSANTKYAYDTTLDYSTGSDAADFLFWVGDLNVRVETNATHAKSLVDQNNIDGLMAFDQLKKAKEQKLFDGWSEPQVTFKPTYKFKPNTDEYDLTATPSWTDRVLYKSGTGKTIQPLSYNSLTNYKQTEHRPVLGMFRVTL
ncbi:72 kDa inositol polyphosphate 5-phosphatase [Cimex lectularius]|uniref:Inositol polyphosphate-related phosphatase domain-containing protein n=2 Tax=Cimex lectularius TaxID=79782 RepID=A0A8I6SQX2_CIMLE|nr:72 kDa inositol polyphosphate 5-phosphatase [Cimex lectularius]